MTVQQLVRRGQAALAQAGSPSPKLDAEVLLMWLLGIDRNRLYLTYPETVSDATMQQYDAVIERRSSGEPVAYITGHREFMGLDFLVDRRVLVPRPETERLVEWAIERLSERRQRALAVDVGTGSGAIAVSLAHVILQTEHTIVGCDVSNDALQVARSNAERLAPGRTHLVCGDLLTWCRQPIDLLLANLPYLRPEQAHPGIAYEPDIALYVAGHGFELYERLLDQAHALIAPGGAIGCEIDPSQPALARDAARRYFPNASIRIEPDLAGLDRYLFIEMLGEE